MMRMLGAVCAMSPIHVLWNLDRAPLPNHSLPLGKVTTSLEDAFGKRVKAEGTLYEIDPCIVPGCGPSPPPPRMASLKKLVKL